MRCSTRHNMLFPALLLIAFCSRPTLADAAASEESLGAVFAAELAAEEKAIEEEERILDKELGAKAPPHKPHQEQVEDFKDCIMACKGDTVLDFGQNHLFDLPGDKKKKPETAAQRKKREASVNKLKECAESCHHHVPKFQEHLVKKREKEVEEDAKKQEANAKGHVAEL
mmetsp:Transcript_44072/g.80514  ORF Transcript_44072/g.80514 Transcript_44072/m.80514 type:complete len:170 (-) Transcript_44072:235-744(-)